MAVKRLSSILCVGLALGGATLALAGPDKPCSVAAQEKAREILRKALTYGERISMNAVVMQRVTSDFDSPCQFSMSQDTSGRRKMVAVKPLVVQGMVSIDDGRQWVNFYPDENRMIVMPSPRGDRVDVESRLKLAFQNYRFAIEPRARIAGRTATVVVAIPKFPGMPVRKFAVDDSNNVLLRVEAFNSDGDREVFFDTKAIQFTVRGQQIDINMPSEPSMRVYKPVPPVRLNKLSDAKNIAGFTPVPVRSLPNGFEAREMIVAGASGSKYVAIRLTDGLVSATLYQFPSRKSPIGADDDSFDLSIQGVTLRLVGELSEEARERMMTGIAKTYGRTIGQARELTTPTQTFSPKRMPEPTAFEDDFLQSLIRLVEELIQEAENDVDPVIDEAIKALPANHLR